MKNATTMLGAFLALVAIPASAVTITADVGYNVEHETSGLASDRIGPTTSTTGDLDNEITYYSRPFVDFVYPSEIGAGSVADVAGRLAGGGFMYFEDDMNAMMFYGESSWSDTVTNNTGGTASFDFDFDVTDGLLQLDGIGSTMFRLDILLDGNSIWNRTASIINDGLGGGPVIETDGLANTIYDFGSYQIAEFDAFSGNLDLGTIANGASFELTYTLGFMASLDSDYSFAMVSIGDPFSAGFFGEISTSGPAQAPVPEPTTMALLGMGLAGLGARRFRKKN